MESFEIKPDQTARTVLVVDDMAANRSVLCRQLEMHKYAVISVESGEAALELLSRSRPDIILLDYMMPKMNGIEVLRELRGNPNTADIPVIMVTARAEGEATAEALNAGADDYVTKPIDFVVLRARIESHLAKRGNTSELRKCNAVLDERMTMRSLVLADMETELREEIDRRKELEARLSQTSPEAAHRPVMDESLLRQLQEIKTRFGIVFAAVVSGKTPNIAQMYELDALVTKLVETSGDGHQ